MPGNSIPLLNNELRGLFLGGPDGADPCLVPANACNRIHTSGITCCSMNIFTATAAAGSAHRTKLAGPALSRNS